MPFPLITSLYTGLAALLVLVLVVRISALRMRLHIGIGDGGDRLLGQRIRAHGNAVEYLPLALLQLGLLELTGHAAWLVHACGAVLILARCLHAFGLSRSAGKSMPRALGTALTWAVMAVMAMLLIARFVR